MSGGSNQPMFHQELPAHPLTCPPARPTGEVPETLLDFELYEMAVCLKFQCLFNNISFFFKSLCIVVVR
jgi:hypothetical protein